MGLTFSLIASPNIAQIKAAVTANPALLDTPQAKAAMAEKGISASDVKAKLDAAKSSSSDTSVSSSESVTNDIDTSAENTETEKVVHKIASTTRRVNPFAYESSSKFNKILTSKQQKQSLAHKLVRYSSKFFVNRNMINSSSIPTPDDYIVTNGDRLLIYIYGDRDQKLTPTVGNDGTINLPYLGPITVGGMKFSAVKKHLIDNLKHHYKTSDFYINMKKYSTIQVTLVGDVKAPGLYNLASFSTLKDLLVASKGINATASVRDLTIKRNGKVIADVDFYDLLFRANKVATIILKQGDIVIVHQAKKLVWVDGYVNNAAIFELKGKENLADAIVYAGGMKPNASKSNIKIKRYANNNTIKTFTLSCKEAKHFSLQNGDKIYIYPLDFAKVQSVNIYGNIIRPGSYHLPKQKTLNALLKKNVQDGLKSFFLPQTYFEYGVIKRYGKGLNYETHAFNILNVLSDKENVKLAPQDQIYIFAYNDIYKSPYVVTKGDALLHPGKLQFFNGMQLRDAINASGVPNGIALDDKVEVTSFLTYDYMPKTKFYSLKKDGNVHLSPYDVIKVFNYYDTHILQPVTISGEVVKPETVYYEKGMTLQKLIAMAGGLTPKAYTKDVEIVRYFIDANQTRERKILHTSELEGNFAEISLQPYDEVRVFSIPKWGDRKVVELKGQVCFPGKYTIQTGEKLSSVIQRAGGFTNEAFVNAAVFTRESIRKNQVRQYNATLAKLKRQLAIYGAMPANLKKGDIKQSLASVNEVMQEAKKYQPLGRVSLKLDRNITKFQKSPYNLVLQDKDTLIVPSKIDTVTVFGEVFNPTSFVYNKSLDADDYIDLASGLTQGADADRIYVIHADGTSEPLESGWWIFASSADVHAGDTVVVPMHIDKYNQLDLWESVSKIMAGFAVTIATLNTIGVF